MSALPFHYFLERKLLCLLCLF